MYKIGDKVAHPMHGAGTIVDIVHEKIDGKITEFLVLLIPIGSMSVMLPSCGCDQIGLRYILSEYEADKVLCELEIIEIEDDTNWNRRYRENLNKIKSGCLYEVAKVIKSLSFREKNKGLSTGERKMLLNAKQIFISEIILAKNLTYDNIDEILKKSIEEKATAII